MGNKCCSCLCFIFIIPPSINVTLIVSIISLSANQDDNNEFSERIDYTIGLSFPSGLILILFIFDIVP